MVCHLRMPRAHARKTVGVTEHLRFEGKFNGHTHMGMLGSTALAQFDVFLDWAEKNIPNPIVKTSCTKRPARGP